ncbi:MAG: DNA translocase FtsK 4TM domain-containing protein [Bacteroidales bacterium]|nr:DNA translocase FtsK 4TM domain-containing protein [Bacteroidales bacterium]
MTSVKDFFRDQRLRKALGLFLILMSVFLLLAFASYLFTWKSYDYLVDSRTVNWELLSDGSIRVDNMMGRLGAVAAHLFIKMGFGVASFLFLPIFVSIGVYLLLGYDAIPIKKTSIWSLFFILWISVFFGFIISSETLISILGGFFGYNSAVWLNGLLGITGTGILLLFTIGTFIIVAFDPNFQHMGNALTGLLRVLRPRPQQAKDVAEVPDDDFIDGGDNESDHVGVQPAVPEDDFFRENAEEESHEEAYSETASEPVILDTERQDGEEAEDREAGEEPEWEIEVGKEKLTGSDYQAIDTPFTNDDDMPDLSHLGEYDPTLDLPHYRMPDLNLLNDRGSGSIQINKEELESNKNRIIDTLKNYAIEIDKIKATVGPTVTLYEIVPAPGIRISKIKNLENDIALSLSALGIRIIAPIPGRGTIGIEVPNSNPEIVSMRSVLASERFRNSSFELPIGLGKTIANETFIADLTKMPHLLMAGATGQGKSVGLNAILTSILYKKHPAYVKFVLIDPKKVELNLFSKIERHYLAKLPDAEEAIVTETREVIRTINSLCVEMDNRYDLLKDAQARNVKEYNVKFVARRLNPNHGHRFLPYIVLFIDEFADLIMTAGKEIELPIARLAQLARAVGIHLVIATQRPSVNIITGTIKANFPARIAFRVTAKVDSRTILDSGGADQLIGRGDMLLSTGSDLLRLQCAFVDTPEIERITDFIGSQRAYPDAFHLPEYFEDESAASEALDPSERDELFEDAARIIVATQQGSTSLIQRKLKLGYNRAGRIIDQLEAAGIVGPFEGSKAREVKIKDEMSLNSILHKEY